MNQQEQFLDVVDRDEAERRFRAALEIGPCGAEEVDLGRAHGRILAGDVAASVDVPAFDRSNVDGFAVRAADTFGCREEEPATLATTGEMLAAGIQPTQEVQKGQATAIATGAMVPRGADAIVMIEDTDPDGTNILVRRAATPGANITFAGTDIAWGESVLRQGQRLSARETGILAAVGVAKVLVVKRPTVAILSTGDEIIPPGVPMGPGLVYDSNQTVLADTVRELGGEPVPMGIVPDDESRLTQALQQALSCDMVVLSGGTSKGQGDLSYRVVGALGPPGIVVHGVALKPGKPLCLAVVRNKPIAVLPGFPTSAIFTFREFLGPILREMAGVSGRMAGPPIPAVAKPAGQSGPVPSEAVARGWNDAKPPNPPLPTVPRAWGEYVTARLPVRFESARGRTEYTLVSLLETGDRLIAYPLGKGSGSVTTFGLADGYVEIPRNREYLEAGEETIVRLIAPEVRLADLVVIGSHCLGLDWLLGRLWERGITSKFLAVGSMAGVEAVRRGECDLAGVHLLDEKTGVYNQPFTPPNASWFRGYRRRQGIVYRKGDARFEGLAVPQAVARALADDRCRMVNRNRGSGTRILLDRLLGTARPGGYSVEPRSHHAVAAAVAQGRADWGMAIEIVARRLDLGFLFHQDEHFDFLIPIARLERPAVQAFLQLLSDPAAKAGLGSLGFLG